VDSYRETIGATADAYSSVVSNQQNVVMKQLAVIATIFLPLTFLTGFFGQNFGALVGHIGSWTTFLIFGVGSELLAVILLYLLFRARGWLRN
jgi:magnesium transporter